MKVDGNGEWNVISCLLSARLFWCAGLGGGMGWDWDGKGWGIGMHEWRGGVHRRYIGELQNVPSLPYRAFTVLRRLLWRGARDMR